MEADPPERHPADITKETWKDGRLQVASAGSGHRPREERLQTRLPAETRRVTSPEDAFVTSGIDSVIVAESRAEESIRLARHASQAEYHVVVVPPRDVSTAFSYELHLLLDDSRRGIVVLTGHW